MIDLGTNTFHLLIVDLEPATHSWKEIVRERVYVKLGEGGLETIAPAASRRAIETMKKYRQKCDQFQVNRIIATGTACLRTALNAPDLIREVKDETGIHIDVISGEREATLIASGIILSLHEIKNPFLIMDIGGGSVEFILCDQDEKILFSKSYPIGVALLFHQYHRHDPISVDDLDTIERMLEQTLGDLISVCRPIPLLDLVGSSGTFEVLSEVLAVNHPNPHVSEVSPASFYPFYKKVLHTHYEERLAMPEIPDTRADLIVVALFLINFILTRFTFHKIIVSEYALKEGIIKVVLDESK